MQWTDSIGSLMSFADFFHFVSFKKRAMIDVLEDHGREIGGPLQFFRLRLHFPPDFE